MFSNSQDKISREFRIVMFIVQGSSGYPSKADGVIVSRLADTTRHKLRRPTAETVHRERILLSS